MKIVDGFLDPLIETMLHRTVVLNILLAVDPIFGLRIAVNLILLSTAINRTQLIVRFFKKSNQYIC